MATPKKGYYNAIKKRVPSVTTIIGRFKDSGGLIRWAYNQGRDGKELYEERDKAADCGTLAHEMVEAYINGENHMEVIKEVDKEMQQQALTAFQNFREWLEQTKIQIISKYQEIQMVSEDHQFGGTPDAIGRLPNGKLVLLDWKTSNSVYPDYMIQVAAYAMLWEELGNEPIEGGFYICRFSKEFPDFSTYFFQELDLAKEQFILLRKAYAHDQILKKRVK